MIDQEYGKFMEIDDIFLKPIAITDNSSYQMVYFSNNTCDVFENHTRAQIYDLVMSEQGISFSMITRELKLANGVVQYHLQTLERLGLIKSVRVGKFTRYYLSGTEDNGLTRTQEDIIGQIQENEGIIQSEIASNLGTSRQVINYNVKQLLDSGIIQKNEKDHNTGRCTYLINDNG
ncbi:MAG: winged helix-turn-helix transcriptional regulator [Thermoplasmata archaeon]|nr:winged helix-turn-helix transcriptional regulator [Thermoplasmata archaeon]